MSKKIVDIYGLYLLVAVYALKNNFTKEAIEKFRNAGLYIKELELEALKGDKEASAEYHKICNDKNNPYHMTYEKIQKAEMYIGELEILEEADNEEAIAELQKIYNKRDNLIENLS